MKKTLAIILILSSLLVLSACGAKKAEVGAKLSTNIARCYTPGNRESRFAVNGSPLDGSVIGKAYFDTSADGKAALAWVDTVLYYVSVNNGVESLGAGISTAELSYDGRLAFFLMDGKIYMFSAETHESAVLEEGVSAMTQLAVSPGSINVFYTAEYENGAVRTMRYADGSLSVYWEDANKVVLAVTDDAKALYYFDKKEGFCVEVDGEARVISKDCGAATNYNFNADLSEVIFSTNDKSYNDPEAEAGSDEIFYRLSDGRTTNLGKGFGYTLKTDEFSISKITLFSYINNIKTFTNGFYLFRQTIEDNYIYSVGLIDGKGEMNMLCENAVDYQASPDGSRVVWLTTGVLHATDTSGRTKELANNVLDFKLSEDGKYAYYITGANSLFRVSMSGKEKKLDSSVSSLACVGAVCVYIKDDGELWYADGKTRVKALDNASRLDRRAGHLLVYSNESEENGTKIYTLHFSTDGKTFNWFADGVEP